ncbi:MAG: hypothetical protein WB439_07775 [Acidobacteriaceae bacterium]
MIQAEQYLHEGATILAEVLKSEGFDFVLIAHGDSSGGRFASGKFIRNNRELEFHFRHSLGMVTYRLNGRDINHADYMQVVLGRSNASHYPGFSDDVLEGFRGLAQDLREHAQAFVTGTDEEFSRYIELALTIPRRAGLPS